MSTTCTSCKQTMLNVHSIISWYRWYIILYCIRLCLCADQVRVWRVNDNKSFHSSVVNWQSILYTDGSAPQNDDHKRSKSKQATHQTTGEPQPLTNTLYTEQYNTYLYRTPHQMHLDAYNKDGFDWMPKWSYSLSLSPTTIGSSSWCSAC